MQNHVNLEVSTIETKNLFRIYMVRYISICHICNKLYLNTKHYIQEDARHKFQSNLKKINKYLQSIFKKYFYKKDINRKISELW